MRRLTFLVFLIAAVYSGYWFFGAKAVKDATQTAITDARDDGWDIAYSDLKTVGFPSRFDTTVADFTVSPPDAAWSWAAPFVQVFALSYQPNNVIAAFAPTQSMRIADQELFITSEDLRASAGVRPNTDLSFKAATVDVGAATVTSDFGWTVALDRALLALRATPDVDARYDVFVEADNIILSPQIIQQIDPEDFLKDLISRFVVEAVVTLDQPLDRHAKTPAPQSILLKQAMINWGPVAVSAQGAVDVDALGVPDGRITIKTQQWREIITLLADNGVIQSRIAPTITNVAQAMAQGDDMLELPISFQNGFMSVGPLPLGPAPRLR